MNGAIGMLDTGTRLFIPAAPPFWQTRPCPPWCDARHSDLGEWAFDDRVHFLLTESVELSLYNADGHTNDQGEYEAELPTLEVSFQQHYRHAEPHLRLEIPIETDRLADYRYQDARLTVAETRALRDRLTGLLDALESAPPTPPHRPVLVQVDAACRQGEEHSVKIELPGHEHEIISTHLQQWTEQGSSPDLEVLVDVAGTPMGLTPADARTAAGRLHHIADRIAELANQAEVFNARLSRQDRPALAVVSAVTDADEPIAA